jgi:hypothetical protein
MTRLFKNIPTSQKKLTASQRKTVFTVLGYKNQTEYLKTQTGNKQEAVRGAVALYNEQIKPLNAEVAKTRKTNKNLQQYGTRLKSDIQSTKPTFSRRFKTDGQFNKMLDVVRGSKKKFLIQWGATRYALSDKTILMLKERYVTNGSFFTEEAEQTESDKVLVYLLQNNKQQKGAFFDMNHKTPFDLSDFQIFTETREENYKNQDCCFIHALKVHGLDDQKLGMLRSLVKTKNLPKYLLTVLCDKIDVRVSVRIPDSEKKMKYGKGTSPIIPLGLINDHYFLIKKVGVTRYALEHYEAFASETNDEWMLKQMKKNKKGDMVLTKTKDKVLDSFDMIDTMYKQKDKYLSPITLTDELYKTTLSNQFTTIDTLEYSEELVRLCGGDVEDDKEDSGEELGEVSPVEVQEKTTTKQRHKPYHSEFFDFETTTDGDKHRPYLARVAGDSKVFINQYTNRKGYDKMIGYELLKHLAVKHKGENLLLFAHNGGYDIKFLFSFIMWEKVIERGTSLLRAYGKFYYEKGKYVMVSIQDTKAYLVCQLKDFSDMFKLEMRKEIMPYGMYNQKTMSSSEVWEKGMTQAKVKKYCKKEKVDFDAFMSNCHEWGCVKEGGRLDIIEYSSRYCDLDCEVLKQGWETFRKWILEITNLDVNNYVSISSMVDKYFKNEGVYEGVFELSSYVREFIQRCMVGGRTMCRENKKYHLPDVRLADFDAVSLYPSAMQRLIGYLKGKPKVLKNCTYDFLQSVDGYFVEIKITKVNKRLSFPLLSRKTEAGIRDFTNDMEGEVVYVDRYMLEDCIKFHGLEFEVIRGYYYDEGRNTTLKTVIEYLFNERLKAKAAKNAIQVVYKLCMNAAYGKTLMKPFDSDTKFLSFERAKIFIERNYNKIKSIDILGSVTWEELEQATTSKDEKVRGLLHTKLKIKTAEPISDHFNLASCGCEVLSMSKRIMNEVMCLAEDMSLNIYYQDTDSMHIDADAVNLLAEQYKIDYKGRELIGKGMGQFHTDFESEVLKGEIYACESIFLGKKCYIDKLTDGETKHPDGSLVYEYHTRMKGMNALGIQHRADEDFDGDLMAVYKSLHDGNTLAFDLCGGGIKPTFDHQSNGTISSKREFIRNIQFK